MRLDLFLKASRLSPRRSVAQKLCDAGLVFVNDRMAKSSYDVKPGDTILMRRGDRETQIKVLHVPQLRQTSRKEATSLYELLSDQTYSDEVG
jgi:ribosomal 50S subunit-recycling heat shock protein